jgi:hypothetical protein
MAIFTPATDESSCQTIWLVGNGASASKAHNAGALLQGASAQSGTIFNEVTLTQHACRRSVVKFPTLRSSRQKRAVADYQMVFYG